MAMRPIWARFCRRSLAICGSALCKRLSEIGPSVSHSKMVDQTGTLRSESGHPRSVDGRSSSDLGSLRQEERVFHVDAEVAHRVLDLGVTT